MKIFVKTLRNSSKALENSDTSLKIVEDAWNHKRIDECIKLWQNIKEQHQSSWK